MQIITDELESSVCELLASGRKMNSNAYGSEVDAPIQEKVDELYDAEENPEQCLKLRCKKALELEKQVALMQEVVTAVMVESGRYKAALQRLADCDWVISLPDRMDAVRQIAREALNPSPPEPRV